MSVWHSMEPRFFLHQDSHLLWVSLERFTNEPFTPALDRLVPQFGDQSHDVSAETSRIAASANPEVRRDPLRVVCHERSRSKRLRATIREMKEGPSGSAIRC